MPISPELVSAGISFIITILILSYLFGDNPLFRVAIYVFVGAAAGYVAAVAWNEVINPALDPTDLDRDRFCRPRAGNQGRHPAAW